MKQHKWHRLGRDCDGWQDVRPSAGNRGCRLRPAGQHDAGDGKGSGAAGKLKVRAPMRWAGLMSCCKAQVEEIIFAELIMI